MNPNLIKQIADFHYQLADLYNQLAADSSDSVRSDAGQGSVPPASPAPALEESPFTPDEFVTNSPTYIATSEDQGSEAVCPAHHKPFIDGKFGPYCPGKGIDPAWTNKRGYCTVNPKNVATYLRVKAAA